MSNVSGSRAGTQRLYDLLEPRTLPLALARVRVRRKAAHGERRQQRGTQERAMAWAETQSRPSHGPPPLPVASSPDLPLWSTAYIPPPSAEKWTIISIDDALTEATQGLHLPDVYVRGRNIQQVGEQFGRLLAEGFVAGDFAQALSLDFTHLM